MSTAFHYAQYHPSSALINQSVFDATGLFDESLPACEDYDLWLRITAKYPVLFLTEKLTYKHGGHADQLSKKYWGMDRFRIKSLYKMLQSGELNRHHYQLTYDMLQKKILILKKGALKHNNQTLITELNQLQISKIEPITSY